MDRETWKKITNFFNHPFIQLLGWGGFATVITWVVTHLAKLPLWEVWLAILFCVGCAFWIMNQIALFRERNVKGLTKLSDKELENTIREWVDIPDMTFKRSDSPDSYFMFTLTDKFNRVIHIARHKKDPHYISIWTDINISSHPALNIELSENDLEKIGVNINLEMARLGIYFSTTGTGTKSIQVRLYNPILLDDSLTAFNFRQQCLFVTRAFVLLMQVLRITLSELGIILPTSEKESSQN